MYDYSKVEKLKQIKYDVQETTNRPQQLSNDLDRYIEEEEFKAIENEEGEIISVMDDQTNKTNR